MAASSHEPWRDEVDPWLFARDAPWSDFFHRTRYVGSPALWFLLQAPLARGGAPFDALVFLHWPIAALAVGLLVFRAPFPLVTRAAIAGSYYFAFEYTVVMRSYALTFALLFLALVTRGSRRGSPLHGVTLGLLANASVPGLLFATALSPVFLWESLRAALASSGGRARARALAGAAATTVGGLLAVVQVRPPADGQKKKTLARLTDPEFELDLEPAWEALGSGLLPGDGSTTTIVLGALAIFLTALCVRRSRAAVTLLVLASGLFFALLALIHAGYQRHWGMFFVVLIAAWWLYLDERPVAVDGDRFAARRRVGVVLLTVLGLLWVPRTAELVEAERHAPFSNGAAMAAYLEREGLAGHRIAASYNALVVLGWLPRGTRFFYPQSKRWGTYLLWDAKQKYGYSIRGKARARRTRRWFYTAWAEPEPDVLLLMTSRLHKPRERGFRWLHSEKRATTDGRGEKLFLYEVDR